MKPATGVWLGLGAMAALTLAFWLTDLDLRAPALAYSPSAPHWPLSKGWPCRIANGSGPVLGGLLVGAALLGAIGSFVSPLRRSWRTPCLLVLFVAALGPGLLVNGVFKNLMGRPRPYETTFFGGTQRFLRPFEPGHPFGGGSFMSGHASMAFLFVVGFFALRGPWRWAFLLGGIALGLVVGMSRVARGDHFPSDVLLAGALDFALAAALARILEKTAPEVPAERCLQPEVRT